MTGRAALQYISGIYLCCVAKYNALSLVLSNEVIAEDTDNPPITPYYITMHLQCILIKRKWVWNWERVCVKQYPPQHQLSCRECIVIWIINDELSVAEVARQQSQCKVFLVVKSIFDNDKREIKVMLFLQWIFFRVGLFFKVNLLCRLKH